ncbi:helix-turn-helix domain-containing protein [Flagellimonas sp. 2504JD4-2]
MVNLPSGQYFGSSFNMVENDLLKLCITKHGKETTIEKHHHENTYLSILFSGSYIEEGNGITQHITAGEALLRPRGYEHQNYFQETEGSCFNVEFKSGWYELEHAQMQRQNQNLQKFKASNYPSLYQLILGLKNGEETDLVFEQVYDWYLDFIAPKAVKQDKQWIKEVVALLNDELDQFHSLENLASRVKVHPVYLSRAFKKFRGCTLSEFQIRLKIDRALYLLLNSSKCISTISFETGFYDDPHFIRSFKSVYGVSPHRFRNTLKG